MALEIRIVPPPADDSAPSLDSSSSGNSPVSPSFPQTPEPRSRKHKGARRLINGFQRMSSSPSLARLGRSASFGYKSNKASVSCMSLNSAGTSFGLTTEYPSGLNSTTPTPGVQIPLFDETARTRYLEQLHSLSTSAIPRSTVARPPTTPGIVEEEDYFSLKVTNKPARYFDFWRDMPSELRTEILSYLTPKEVVRCSLVSKDWHRECFNGQLWAVLDTNDFYKSIPADALIGIISSAGPFVRDLNLRGCVQLRGKWSHQGLADACRNLKNFTLEGCKIDRTSVHCFLLQNPRLVNINLSGLTTVTNASMRIIAQHCPLLETLNLAWCSNVDTRGLHRVVEQCEKLTDLRVGEMRGWDAPDFNQLLFETNRLERLLLMNCISFDDEALKIFIRGENPEIDILTGRPIVPPRRLRHLDLSRCSAITDRGMRVCANNLDNLEVLRLSKCFAISDGPLEELLPTLPNLVHLDIEELEQVTNSLLQTLARSPCAPALEHLSISYCENLGDTGMLAVLKVCTSLATLEMDNTRVSDLTLVEAASMLRARGTRSIDTKLRPVPTLNLIAYDCANVTWTGVREILSRNAEIVTQRRILTPIPIQRRVTEPIHRISSDLTRSSHPAPRPAPPSLTTETVHLVRTYPTEIINLKCFYNYQPTVQEHTKRVLRGDFAAANRLERKWAEFMIASEEADTTGVGGTGARRRRRRAREAMMMHADEAEQQTNDAVGSNPATGRAGTLPMGNGIGVGGGRRRRARSGGCTVM